MGILDRFECEYEYEYRDAEYEKKQYFSDSNPSESHPQTPAPPWTWLSAPDPMVRPIRNPGWPSPH